MLGGPEAGKRVPPGEAAKEVTLVLTDVQVSACRTVVHLSTAQRRISTHTLCSCQLVLERSMQLLRSLGAC
jgi:hypothetical protein